MAFETISNGESGSSVRAKINAVIAELNSVKRYYATLTQASNNPPVPVVLKNEFGPAVLTWGYTSAGKYKITSDVPVFTSGRTMFEPSAFFTVIWISTTEIHLEGFFNADDELSKTPFKLEVYA
jgi:hypothetical protein